MSAGSKFHSCGEETEKPLLPDRSFRYRGTRSWTWDDDRRLRLAGISFTEWHNSIRYSGARPARQLLVMELSLYRIRSETGSQSEASFGGGLGGRRPPPQGKRKKEKRKKKRKKRKKRKKEKKKEGNYEWRQITTYKVLFFQFFNSPVSLKNKKKFCPQEKVEMTPLEPVKVTSNCSRDLIIFANSVDQTCSRI